MSQWTTRVRVVVAAVVGALALFLFVYPTRALVSQGNDIGQTRHDLVALQLAQRCADRAEAQRFGRETA